MYKKVLFMLLLLLSALLYMFGHSMAAALSISPTHPPPQQTQTRTPTPETCTIKTGYAGGRVNLRFGDGTSHAVNSILSEGERLTIITNGANWIQVKTESDAHGWIKSKFCNKD